MGKLDGVLGNFIGNPFWNYEVPEFELEGLWYLNIIDNKSNETNSNSIFYTDYFPLNTRVDYYISSVNIPQLNLNYDTTDIGMVYFKDKSSYDTITMSFYDDLKSSFKSFIIDWLHTIYDEKTQSIKSNWRYEAKDIIVTNYRNIWGRIQKTATYGLLKCLPKGLSEINMEDDGGDRKSYSLQLICQKVETDTDKLQIIDQNIMNYGMESSFRMPIKK